MEKAELTENQISIKIHELSDKLEIPPSTINWIHYAIGQLSEGDSSDTLRTKRCGISGRDLCVALLKDLVVLYDRPLAQSLESIKIKSSEDIGRVVFGLVDANLIKKEEGDDVSDFENLFSLDDLGEFIKIEGIEEKRVSLYKLYRFIMWTIYIFGFGVVVSSYFGFVDNKVAWIGWTIGMVGFLMQYLKLPKKKRF